MGNLRIIPVILSGGTGSRLWPVSRGLYPKQLLPLIGEQTMLQETVARLDGLAGAGDPIIVCNEAHRFLVAEQMRELGVTPRAIILEPAGRNTAPAAAVAAHAVADTAADAVLLLLPADHLIRDPKALQAALRAGADAAAAGHLVTFGVRPERPETGYGYIRTEGDSGPAVKVAEFVEKPDLDTARQYFESGNYYWNSGMFMFVAARYLQELEMLAPEILSASRAAFTKAKKDLDFERLDAAAFEGCPSDSIDYAVMEKTKDAVLVPLDAGWSDVGSWSALHEVSVPDDCGNVVRGDVVAEDTHNCYISAGHRLVATVGLDEHVVVETKDAVMVAPKNKVQDVKKLVERLRSEQREEADLHRQVFRPWGSYDSIDSGSRFQVKRLIVNPGAVLSLQLHHRRAEHWVVVKGTARVTRGEDVFLLEENESTFIPIETKHRIENPGTQPLHIIEVQSGEYLGEDDIVRFEDNYGRKGSNK